MTASSKDVTLEIPGLSQLSSVSLEKLHIPLTLRIDAHVKKVGKPAVVGLCGAQGSGKSTSAVVLRQLLEAQGYRVAIVSLDDLYLLREDRLALAERVHPLFATRGPPGTHDVELGCSTIRSLLDTPSTLIPRFDKALDTRHSPQQCEQFRGPADIIVLEGWCVGARPEPSDRLVEPINALEKVFDPDGVWRTSVNEALAGRYQDLFAFIDFLILLKAPTFDVVFEWRMEQESKLRGSRLGENDRLMNNDEIVRFVRHYERITRHILAEMPGRADVVVELDNRREPQRFT